MEPIWSKHETYAYFEEYKISEGWKSTYTFYYIPCFKLIELRDCSCIKKWKHNRPHDEHRVLKLRKYQNLQKHVNGTIHLAYLKEEGLVCYEGNHRFQALTTEVPHVVVDIMWNASFDDVKREFLAINSGENVSELYTKITEDDTMNRVKEQIEEYTEETILVHKGCSGKGKVRANRPMFLVDDFKTKIFNLYKYFSKKGFTIEQILQALDYLNDAFSTGERNIEYTKGKKLSDKAFQKACEMEFYLYCPAEPLRIADVKWALERQQ